MQNKMLELIQAVQRHWMREPLLGSARVMKDDERTLAAVLSFHGGKVFAKWMRSFDMPLEQGLRLQYDLHGRGYPACCVLPTMDGALWVPVAGGAIAVFEVVEGMTDEWPPMDRPQLHCYGAALGKFHRMTAGEKLQPPPQAGVEPLLQTLREWNEDGEASGLSRIDNLKKILRSARCNVGEPTGSFAEFNPGHVAFLPDGSLRVVDWEVGWRVPLFDIGGAAVASFHPLTGEPDVGSLAAFLAGYTSERPLTQDEAKWLPAAIAFGCAQYAIWGMMAPSSGKLAPQDQWAADDVARLDWLIGAGSDALRRLVCSSLSYRD